MRRLNIAVAGCGPAGLAAAIALARDGHAVTLFERFDAPRPVGSGLMLQPTGAAVLRELGLADAVSDRASRIVRLSGLNAHGRVVLDVRYSALPGHTACALGVHRAALFDVMHGAACAQNLPIETGRAVVAAPLASGARRRLVFADGTSAGPFELVVDALGAHSPLDAEPGRELPYGALWASLDWPTAAAFDGAALEQRYIGAHTMAGVMPIGRIGETGPPQAAFFWSLRQDRLDAWRREGLATWKAQVVSLWPATAPLLDQIADAGRLTFARYRHRTRAVPAGPALIHIGDSWRSTSPQLGQGANMALLDAYALALALRSAPDLASALVQAVALRRRHVAIYQAMSFLFTPVYQSDSRSLPVLRDWLVGPIARRWPATSALAALVAGAYGAPLRRLGLKPSP